MKFSCGKMIALISTFVFFLSIAQLGKMEEPSPAGSTNDNTTVPSSSGTPVSNSGNTTVPSSSGTPVSNSGNNTVPTSSEAPVSNTTVPTVPTVPTSTDNNATNQTSTTSEKKPHKCVLKKDILDHCASEGQICGELNNEEKSVKSFNNTCDLKVFNCQNRDFKLKYQTVDLARCNTATPKN